MRRVGLLNLLEDTIFSIIIGMTRADKTLQKMRNNPRDWCIEALEAVAARYGINVRKQGGSHVVFSHSDSPMAVTVPAHRPIKPIYVRQLIDLIDEVRGE